MANSKEKLFTEFPPVSTQEWMDKVAADLKGADFEKKLVWRTNEGFSVKPMYRAEDLEGLATTTSLPGEFPFVRGTKKDNEWLVRQDILETDPVAANAKAHELLMKGVNSLGFKVESDFVHAESIAALLKDIDPVACELNFRCCVRNASKLIALLGDYYKANNVDVMNAYGSIDFDPFKRILKKGRPFDNMTDAYKEVYEAAAALPRFRVFSVNALSFNNAGSYIYQELGYALSWGNEIMAQLTAAGLPANMVAKRIKFNFGVGSNYFMEIAKFRAARMLWANIVKAYDPQCQFDCPNKQADGLCTCAMKMRTHAETSSWNLTIYDAHVNMLRTQTEAMSASIAGVDSLTVTPFDSAYKQADDFSQRIARNQQLLLKEESHFDKIVDAAAGSYYIENLTNSIAEQAWKLFLDIEDKGGFKAAVDSSEIQNEINKAGAARKDAIAKRREILLGTNQYPNFNEKAGQKITLEDHKCGCGCNCNTEEGLVKLDFSRGASDFETLRLATEKAAKRPKAFMLTIGNLAMRLARAQFSCNFFACAGYEVIDNLGFETIEAGVDAAMKAGADFIVLCSSDDEYETFAPEAKVAIGDRAVLVVAGAPACMDALKEQGITEFINVRSNVLETLKGYNAKMGI
ncbi:MAG: methylmalonyl-CoA mutase small subunit [Bacteroidales bacterium]